MASTRKGKLRHFIGDFERDTQKVGRGIKKGATDVGRVVQAGTTDVIRETKNGGKAVGRIAKKVTDQ